MANNVFRKVFTKMHRTMQVPVAITSAYLTDHDYVTFDGEVTTIGGSKLYMETPNQTVVYDFITFDGSITTFDGSNLYMG